MGNGQGQAPGNVVQAINEVQPFAVDLCTGVRTDGRLDAVTLRQFTRQVRAVQ